MRAFLLYLCLFLLFGQHCLSQTISGPEDVCANSCEIYSINGGAGGPYFWSATNGNIDTNYLDSVKVCWDDIQNSGLSVTDFAADQNDNIVSILVNVYPRIKAEIVFPIVPICDVVDSVYSDGQHELPPLICKTVCPESITRFLSPPSADHTYSWEISSGTILADNGNTIDVQWNASGMGSLQLKIENAAGCVDSIKYCIEILDPAHVQIVETNGISSPAQLCLNQGVNLEAVSDDHIDFQWISSDGQLAYGSQASFDFNQAGNYQLMLLASTSCQCSDTVYYDIVVESSAGPEIDCAGTICAGESQTYYATIGCSDYDWSVSPEGIVLDGGGANDDFITILWNSGPSGTVSLSTFGCDTDICAEETIVNIGIIDGNAFIEGPDVVCSTDLSLFTAPEYEGVSYSWSISGNGFAVDGLSSQELLMGWNDLSWLVDTAFIELVIENCYLGCTAYDSKTIQIKREYIISGRAQVCENAGEFFQAAASFDGAIADWEIISPLGSVVETYADLSWINPIFSSGPGVYEIIAYDDSGKFCNDEANTFVNVYQSPPDVNSIVGSSLICQDEFYSYSLADLPSNYQINWTFKDGMSSTSLIGEKVAFEWTTNGPYFVEVYIVDLNTGCRSTTHIMEVFEIDPAAVIGDLETCKGIISSYQLDGLTDANLNWAINPPDAGAVYVLPNGQLEITWHESGNHSIDVTSCGVSETVYVDVGIDLLIAVNAPDALCPGDLGFVDIFEAGGSSVEVYDESGTLVSTEFEFFIGPGSYTILMISDQGCVTKSSFTIMAYELPKVNITTPGPRVFGGTMPLVTLYALNTNAGYAYQWYHNNNPIGIDADSLVTDLPGTYYVVVTDQNGCMAQSLNSLGFIEGDGPPATCIVTGDINFSFTTPLYCDEVSFTNLSTGYMAGSINYNFDDPASGVDNFSNDENPVHKFSDAGYYYVSMIGLLPNTMPPPEYCMGIDAKVITVPVSADYTYQAACSGEPVIFEELVNFLPSFSVVSYDWDFGDPASGADNVSTLANPQHIFSLTGKYTVSLTVRANTGCISRIEKEIEILPSPEFDFDISVSRCTDEGIKFSTLDTGNIVKLEWDFDDPASGTANQSTKAEVIHEFANSGTYNVSLTVENIYGCVSRITRTIAIGMNSISGQIQADKSFPICPEETVNLSFPVGGLTYFWSTGETTQSITALNAGLYELTVTAGNGCAYHPEPIFVYKVPEPFIEIAGYVYDENGISSDAQYDGIELCEGQDFSLGVWYNFQWDYLWSNGSNTPFQSTIDLANTPAGEHFFSVQVTDSNTSCVYNSDPFRVLIHARDPAPQIEADQVLLCEGSPIELRVSNPNPDLIYYWNTNRVGASINVFDAGQYYVTGVNEYGCATVSNIIEIHPKPNTRSFSTGCHMACFPDTLCISDDPSIISYQWLLDGQEIAAPEGTIQNYIAQEAGSYQVILENVYGCIDTTEILSIDPEPGDQSISGKVYLDKNEDEIFNLGDEALENVPVHLYTSNALVETQLTDVNGDYLFDPIMHVNLSIEIDTTGLGLELVNPLLIKLVDFDSCLEDKVVDFPLKNACIPSSESVVLDVCAGSSIFFDGMELFPGDVQLFSYSNEEGCDSTVDVSIQAFPLVEIELQIEQACSELDNGSVIIQPISGMGLSYAIDANTNFSSQTVFANLAAGLHDIFIMDINSCLSQMSFEVPEDPEPEINLVATSPCPDSNNGSILVENTSAGSFMYSLDGVNFQSSNLFEDLAAGSYTVFVQDNQCDHSYAIELINDAFLDVNIDVPTIDCSVSQINLIPSINSSAGPVLFEWSTGAISESLNINASGQYSLLVSDLCSSQLFEWDIQFSNISIEQNIYKPNVFSPNNDGQNECFRLFPATEFEVENYEFYIFDRWGELMFEAYDPESCWDGMFHERHAETGVYAWLVKFDSSFCGESKSLLETGSVTLLR